MPATHQSARSSTAVRTLQWGQHALFTVLLLVGCGQAVARHDEQPGWVLAASVLLLGWYAAGIVVARRWGSRGAGVTWLLGLVAIWAVLASVSPGFRWLVFALCLLTLHLLPLAPALAVVVLGTAWVVVLQLRDNPGDPTSQVLGPTLGAVVAVGIAAGYRAVLDESRRRQVLVEQLTQARDETERLADELARTQRESGALAERARLARDIHDTLAQGFSSVLLLSRAELARGGDPTATLRQIERTASDNLAEARRVVHALAPAALTDAPLPAALQRLASALSEETPIRCEFEVSGVPRPVPTAVEVAVVRLAQGALANVRLHSRASRCVLTLDYDDVWLRLDVVDDGVGFDVDDLPPSASGFGLRAMRERVAELGGTLEVESAPHDGCAIAVALPVSPVPADGQPAKESR